MIFQLILTEDSEELLKDLGVNFGYENRNIFVVEGLMNDVPHLVSKDDDLELGASASPEEPSSSNSYSPPLAVSEKLRKRCRASDNKSVHLPTLKNNYSQLKCYESPYSIGNETLN